MFAKQSQSGAALQLRNQMLQGSHRKILASETLSREEEEEEFYMLRPVNKTDHMQQGMNFLALWIVSLACKEHVTLCCMLSRDCERITMPSIGLSLL